MKAEVLTEPVLVGREKELDELQKFLALAVEGKGRTVFVSGEAGSGKTRLAHEFIKNAEKKGVTILAGWCLSNVTVPYFPFLEAFKSYFSTADNESDEKDRLELTAWLTGLKQVEKTGKYGNLAPQAWQDLTFAAVTEVIASISTKKPTVLFIEDIHWADSASLALLHYITRTMSSEKLMILATFRREELTADAEGHQHPLEEELCLMKREEIFAEIKLANLDKNSVSEVAENMIGGRVSTELAAKLAEESRGNALFVVESLRMMSERGELYQKNNEWQLSVDILTLPDKLKDIIMRRLGGLKFSQRRILDAASVIGYKFDVELLSGVLGQDSLEVLETLNVIAQSTSLVNVEESFFKFNHEKTREAIYNEIPLPLKKGYHARVAERLESTNRGVELPLSDMAYHYAEAGNKKKAVEYALAAGQDALAKFSNAEAVKHFSFVVEAISDSSENAERKRIALEALGDAYNANRKYKEAVEVYELLAESETGKVRLRAYRKAMDASIFGTWNSSQFTTLLRKAESYAESDRLESARIQLFKASSSPGGIIEAEMETVLRIFEEEYSLPDIARALNILGLTALELTPSMKRSESQSLAELSIATAIFEELGDLRKLVIPIWQTGLALYLCGFFEEACNMLRKAVKIGKRIGAQEVMARSTMYLGEVYEQMGLLEEAVSESLMALEYCRKTDRSNLLGQIYADLMKQYAKLGNLESAEKYHQSLLSMPPEILFPIGLEEAKLRYLGEIARAQAVFFSSKNQWKEAKRYFEQATILSEKRQLCWNFFLRKDYAWALNKQGRTEEAKFQLEEIEKINSKLGRKITNANLQAILLAPRNVVAGEDFEMRLYLVNISKKAGLLVKIEELVPSEFKIVDPSANYTVENGFIDMKEKSISPFEVETIKLVLKAPNSSSFNLNPKITYIDESGETRICKPKKIIITVNPAQLKFEIMPGRISTGFEDLDIVLLGGIPERYAVALTSPANDEREHLIRGFLETGAKSGEATFFVTAKLVTAEKLAEKYPSNFYVFICNSQAADGMIQNIPNVSKLTGVENLTEIDIALTKAFRKLTPSPNGPRRICIEVVSDVLLQHHAMTTRRWLSALLPTLKSKGFTTLGILDPPMHPSEEVQAILGLFDGEIRISERETVTGLEKVLRIRKLSNQKYKENELILTRTKFEE